MVGAGERGLAVGGTRGERPGLVDEQEARAAGRQPARFADGHPGDLVDLERRPDLVGQFVDQVQLAVAIEASRARARLSISREHAYDSTEAIAPAGRGPSTQPTVSPSTVMGKWSLAVPGPATAAGPA